MKAPEKLLILLLPFLIPLLVFAADFNSNQFQQQLSQLKLTKKFKNVRLGIALAELPAGKLLFQENEEQGFMPASTIKLILTAAALHRYPLTHRFKIPVGYTGELTNGVLKGNLCLKGIGAPTITLDALKQAVLELKQQGLGEIQGSVLYDDFAFKPQSPRYPPFARDRWAPGGALVLNSNRIGLKIISRTPEFKFEKVPNTAYARIKAELSYVDNNSPSSPDMRYEQTPTGDIFTLKGKVTRWTEQINYLALGATRPGLYFATVFKELLQENGIKVTGKIEQQVWPAETVLLTDIPSPSLKELLLEMNTTSDNIIAENLFWKIGLDEFGPPGDAIRGGNALKQFVGKIISAPEFVCADGSGLSPNNNIAPATFIQLLIHISQHIPEVLPVLPVEPISTQQYRISGKSGTLSARGINALAGFISVSGTSPQYAFVIFAHRQPNPSKLWSGTLTHPIAEVLLGSLGKGKK